MPTVIAIFPDPDGQVIWQDGQISGVHSHIRLLDDAAARGERAMTRPDGTLLSLADWRTDPWAFIAGAQTLDPGVRFRTDGLPEIDDGPPADRHAP